LSAREVAILERIVLGDSNKHVARFFKIAEPTVKAHVKAIFRKIGASNRTQAAIWALSNRVFDPELDATADLPMLIDHAPGR
jgi:two-component system nitrate/nitrite response regulator NarL